MGEASAKGTLKGQFKKRDPDCVWQNIEDIMSTGIADSTLIFKGRVFFLEAKHVKKHPARATTRVKPGLTPEQCLWLRGVNRAGGTALVWVRDFSLGWALFDDGGVHDFDALVDGIPLCEWREAVEWCATSIRLTDKILGTPLSID